MTTAPNALDLLHAVSPELAARQVRHLDHATSCASWERVRPEDCDCGTRPLVDLLMAIAEARA